MEEFFGVLKSWSCVLFEKHIFGFRISENATWFVRSLTLLEIQQILIKIHDFPSRNLKNQSSTRDRSGERFGNVFLVPENAIPADVDAIYI